MPQKISDPFSIFDIRFPPWYRFDMLSIDQEQFHMSLQQVVDGFPEDPGTLHRHMASDRRWWMFGILIMLLGRLSARVSTRSAALSPSCAHFTPFHARWCADRA